MNQAIGNDTLQCPNIETLFISKPLNTRWIVNVPRLLCKNFGIEDLHFCTERWIANLLSPYVTS